MYRYKWSKNMFKCSCFLWNYINM